MFRFLLILTSAILVAILFLATTCRAQNTRSSNKIVAGVVDDALGRPIVGATVTVSNAGKLVQRAKTDKTGRFRLKNIRAGNYSLTVAITGFEPANLLLEVPRTDAKPLLITLASEQALSLPVTATRVRAQNTLSSTGASEYTLTRQDINNLPQGEATSLNQVMLQMPGVALDQNQEIHIRGEHMGIQYQMNGIMLPLDMNTDPTFTQVLNSYFVDKASLIDGVLPARYGYRTAGVIDIHTRDGCDGSHNSVTVLGGQRDTAQGSFELGGCGDKLSYYVTGLFLQSNLGFSSAVPAPDPVHDAVTQGQAFGYFRYTLGPSASLSLITGMTLAFNQFPNQPNLTPQYQLYHINPASYPSSAINSGLNQQDYFGVLALKGAIGADWDYQLAYSAHYNSETFYPDPIGDLIYQGIASNVFTSDLSNTLQGDLTYHLDDHAIRGGFYFGEYGVETDQTSQVFPIVMGTAATTPISVAANLNKINLVYGVYLEDTWQITDRLSVNFGSRWDRVSGITNGSQFSPTINFIYRPQEDWTAHAGFSRNFQVPNFQGISPGISRLFAGTTGAIGTSSGGNTSPYPETDYTWDVGFTHRLTRHLVFANDNYFRIDRHYLDEGQFGYVPIEVPFNYVRGYGGGTEESLTWNLENFAFRLNAFVAREEDIGVASGQYNFPPAELSYIDRHYFVLDHTPLVGASGGAAYRWKEYQFTLDGLFSSGLRGGFANETQLPKVWQFNLSAARSFDVPGLGKLTNRIILLNIFDRTNLIRPSSGIGVFQAAYGPRITVYDALTIPLPAI